MKFLLILTISCISLALCHGACFVSRQQVITSDGTLVAPDGCMDPYDNSEHDFESVWDTADCQRCSCDSRGEVQCCSRYGGIAVMEGCTTVADPETCTYKFYRTDNPTIPCPGP